MRQRETQRERILELLKGRSPAWVPLPEILSLGIAMYTVRILELRRQGERIENKTERVGQERRSWYRWTPPKGQGVLQFESATSAMTRSRAEVARMAPLSGSPPNRTLAEAKPQERGRA